LQQSHPAAYGRIEQALPITADERMCSADKRAASPRALVDQLMKKKTSAATAQHPARLGAAMAQTGRSTELRD